MPGTDRWNNGMAARQAADDARWKSMLEMINKTTPQTMLGYGLGRLVKGYFDRGQDKAARKKKQENEQRMQMGTNAAVKAGVVPVSGVLGDASKFERDFYAGNGGFNPITLQAYGEALKAEKPSKNAPVAVITTTTEQEYPFDPQKYSSVSGVNNQQAMEQPLNLTDRAAAIQQQEMDLANWAKNNIPLTWLRK